MSLNVGGAVESAFRPMLWGGLCDWSNGRRRCLADNWSGDGGRFFRRGGFALLVQHDNSDDCGGDYEAGRKAHI